MAVAVGSDTRVSASFPIYETGKSSLPCDYIWLFSQKHLMIRVDKKMGTTGSCETATKSCGTESSCDSSGQSQNLMQRSRQEGTCAETQVQGSAASAAGFGMGQKTLRQFCDDEGIALFWALSHLRNKGFTAREAMTMRQIADGAGVHPRELRGILLPQ